MVILSFLVTLLWIAMLIGFLVAVFWLIAIVVFVRGFKRWVHGDQIEEEEDRLLDDVMPSQRRFPPPWSVHSKRGTPRPAKD